MAAAETDEKEAHRKKIAAEESLVTAEDRQCTLQQVVTDIEKIKSGDMKTRFLTTFDDDELSGVSQTVRDLTARATGKAAFAFVEVMNAHRKTFRDDLHAAREQVEDFKRETDRAVHAASKASKRVRRAKRERKAKDAKVALEEAKVAAKEAEVAAEEAAKTVERLSAEVDAASDTELEEDGEKMNPLIFPT